MKSKRGRRSEIWLGIVTSDPIPVLYNTPPTICQYFPGLYLSVSDYTAAFSISVVIIMHVGHFLICNIFSSSCVQYFTKSFDPNTI